MAQASPDTTRPRVPRPHPFRDVALDLIFGLALIGVCGRLMLGARRLIVGDWQSV